MQASSVAASGASRGDCVWDRAFIEGNATASDAEVLRKDMGEVRSFSVGANLAGAPVVRPWEGYGRSPRSILNDVGVEKY